MAMANRFVCRGLRGGELTPLASCNRELQLSCFSSVDSLQSQSRRQRINMRAFVVVVALLLQQVMGDGSTELVAKASNSFSNKLYAQLAEKPGNVLVCPISLHIALGLVQQGAGGTTASELATVLGLSAPNSDVRQSYKSLLTSIKDDVLKIATKLFPAEGFVVNPEYVSISREYFLSDVQNLDFAKSERAAGVINQYVEDHTNNKITNLISADALSELTRLVIVNAVHFQATWKHTFDTTYDDQFHVSAQEKVPTKMMTQTDSFGYKEDSALDAKVLRMEYAGGSYSMLFILPNQEDGLAALEAKLATTDLSAILDGVSNARVEVTIPKFKVEQTHNLNNVLQKMGIKDMFSSRADLKGISSGESLYVSDVIQKTFINVHENGTEAAAATGILIQLMSAPSIPPRRFYANHPFVFSLLHDEGNTVLFTGRMSRPTLE